MTKPLTPKRREVLDFIVDYLQEHDYAPSYREIAAALRLASPSTVHVHVQALKEAGYLETAGDIASRSMRQLTPTSTAVNWEKSVLLPLKGLITAGQPIEAIEENETVSVPSSLVTFSEGFALRVQGDSMIEEGIFDGDIVIVEKRSRAKNGDVVVALIDQTYATLKKFYQETGRIRLQPANKTMKPIYARNVLVQGIVRGLIRLYA